MKEQKDTYLNIRITSTNLEMIKAQAKQMGMSLSNYVVMKCLGIVEKSSSTEIITEKKGKLSSPDIFDLEKRVSELEGLINEIRENEINEKNFLCVDLPKERFGRMRIYATSKEELIRKIIEVYEEE